MAGAGISGADNVAAASRDGDVSHISGISNSRSYGEDRRATQATEEGPQGSSCGDVLLAEKLPEVPTSSSWSFNGSFSHGSYTSSHPKSLLSSVLDPMPPTVSDVGEKRFSRSLSEGIDLQSLGLVPSKPHISIDDSDIPDTQRDFVEADYPDDSDLSATQRDFVEADYPDYSTLDSLQPDTQPNSPVSRPLTLDMSAEHDFKDIDIDSIYDIPLIDLSHAAPPRSSLTAPHIPQTPSSLLSQSEGSDIVLRHEVKQADHKSAVFLPPQARLPHNKVSLRERKRILTSTSRPPSLTKAMLHWTRKTEDLVDPFREDQDCWLHPSPPPGRSASAVGILRPYGNLQKRFTWQDRVGRHSLVVNYGIVHKLVNYKMTKHQVDGFVTKSWHLSHLCGNWTCLNPRHTTVEPGKTNISRNSCFAHRSGCGHVPVCLKDKKLALGVDGKVVDLNASVIGTGAGHEMKTVVDWDDWSHQEFQEGEESMLASVQEVDNMNWEGDIDEDLDEHMAPAARIVSEVSASERHAIENIALDKAMLREPRLRKIASGDVGSESGYELRFVSKGGILAKTSLGDAKLLDDNSRDVSQGDITLGMVSSEHFVSGNTNVRKDNLADQIEISSNMIRAGEEQHDSLLTGYITRKNTRQSEIMSQVQKRRY